MATKEKNKLGGLHQHFIFWTTLSDTQSLHLHKIFIKAFCHVHVAIQIEVYHVGSGTYMEI